MRRYAVSTVCKHLDLPVVRLFIVDAVSEFAAIAEGQRLHFLVTDDAIVAKQCVPIPEARVAPGDKPLVLSAGDTCVSASVVSGFVNTMCEIDRERVVPMAALDTNGPIHRLYAGLATAERAWRELPASDEQPPE